MILAKSIYKVNINPLILASPVPRLFGISVNAVGSMSAVLRREPSVAASRLCRMSSHMATLCKAANAVTINPSQPCKEIRIPVPWGHIAAKEWGNPGGRRIIGLHGWQDNCGTFDPLVPLLPQDFHFVAIDLSGHGRSSHRPVGMFYHMVDYVADVRRVIKHLQWNNAFSFITHSMGSGVALMYASAYPKDVDKMVALDSLRPPNFPAKDLAVRMAQGIDKLLEYERLSRLPQRDVSLEDAVELIVDAMNGSVNENGAVVLLKRGSVPSGNEDKITFTRDNRLKIASPPGFTYEQFVAVVKKIRAELLIIMASKGITRALSTPEEVNELLQIYGSGCRSFKLVSVEGTHHVHLNHPERVASHIIEFFKSEA